jgi:glycogen(starch) synthase
MQREAPVAHVTSQYPPVGRGGLGSHVRGLARELARFRSVRVFAPVGADAGDSVGVSPQVGSPLDPEAAMDWGLALAAWAQREEHPPIIHAHNYEAALPALVGRALVGARLVVTLHLPAPEQHRGLERGLLAAADAVIVVSRALGEEYRRRGWWMPAPQVVPNGVDTSFFTPDAAVAREPRRLLFAGRLAPQKGCDVALEALAVLVAEFEDLRLRVAGAGPWERAYRNLARSLGCPHRVEWLGWLDGPALRDEYRRCGAFLMPSRYEPFGLAALEAMACGAPVIASHVDGIAEYLRGDQNGVLIRPGEAAALAAGVRALLTEPQRAARLGLAAAATARGMSWSRAAAATTAVYDGLTPVLGRRTRIADPRRLAETIVTAALQAAPEASSE